MIVIPAVAVPVGSIIPFVKSMPGLPLPYFSENWVECDGQPITDPASPLFGQNVPDLNSTNTFLRGNLTSGTTGGANSITLTTGQLPAHTHDALYPTAKTFKNPSSGTITPYCDPTHTHYNTGSAGAGNAIDIQPKYYNIVWIIRIK